jgi:hypothetical protein
MKTIDVIIDTDGNIAVQTSGFSGPECKQATADLERALGTVTDDRVTSEYHRRPLTTIKTRS